MCGTVHMLPPETAPTRAPDDAVAHQPDGPAWLDAIVAHALITDAAWPLVCGAALTQRLAAVRLAALACRTPDTVADALFRATPPASTPCGTRLSPVSSPAHTGCARCSSRRSPSAWAPSRWPPSRAAHARCPDRERVDALYALGRLRLAGGRDVAQRIAAAGPPPMFDAHATPDVAARYADAYRAGQPPRSGPSRIDVWGGGRDGARHAASHPRRRRVDDAAEREQRAARERRRRPGVRPVQHPGESLDPAVTRELLWQFASDEAVGAGARQRALLTLARLGDARASGEGLAHNPLTSDQRTVVVVAITEARTGRPASNGSHRSGHGHHHWH